MPKAPRQYLTRDEAIDLLEYLVIEVIGSVTSRWQDDVLPELRAELLKRGYEIGIRALIKAGRLAKGASQEELP